MNPLTSVPMDVLSWGPLESDPPRVEQLPRLELRKNEVSIKQEVWTLPQHMLSSVPAWDLSGL